MIVPAFLVFGTLSMLPLRLKCVDSVANAVLPANSIPLRFTVNAVHRVFQPFTFTFMHLADAFIQSDLHCIQVTILHLISSCFPWELNP